MKNKSLITIFCCLFAVGMITMSGCKKNETTTLASDTDLGGSSDNALAEGISSDVVSIGSQASDKGSVSSYREGSAEDVLSACASVMNDTVNKIITVTFNGSTCLDGRTRSGTLTFNYTASTNGAMHYRDPGFTCSVSGNNYVVDGHQVTIISKTITNTTAVGFNPLTTNETWSISANISVVKANNSGTVTWTCGRTMTLLNTAVVYTNAATPINWLMAKIEINGSSNGTRTGGETFTATATNMVRDFGGCTINGKHPFISGTLDYQPGGKYLRHIDFGNGTCDLTATVTINGVSHTITLP